TILIANKSKIDRGKRRSSESEWPVLGLVRQTLTHATNIPASRNERSTVFPRATSILAELNRRKYLTRIMAVTMTEMPRLPAANFPARENWRQCARHWYSMMAAKRSIPDPRLFHVRCPGIRDLTAT